jgi:uncharacterized membrane protein
VFATLNAMSEPPPRPAIDRDLYCLTCGYNLRGLTGDPIRCPECGHFNPVGDAEIPAEIISRKLREMENAPAMCLGAILFGVPLQIVFWWTCLTPGPARDLLHCMGIPAFAPVLAWIGGVVKFRSSCLGKQRWVGLLARYHTYGLLTAAAMVGPMVLALHYLWPYAAWSRGTSGWLLFMGVEIALCLAVVVLVRRLLPGPYERLAADMHVLQREVAVTIAREESRRRMARRPRRSSG